jgi:hypothetical protein
LVTLQPQPGGRPQSPRRTCGGIGLKKNFETLLETRHIVAAAVITEDGTLDFKVFNTSLLIS